MFQNTVSRHQSTAANTQRYVGGGGSHSSISCGQHSYIICMCTWTYCPVLDPSLVTSAEGIQANVEPKTDVLMVESSCLNIWFFFTHVRAQESSIPMSSIMLPGANIHTIYVQHVYINVSDKIMHAYQKSIVFSLLLQLLYMNKVYILWNSGNVRINSKSEGHGCPDGLTSALWLRPLRIRLCSSFPWRRKCMKE